MTEEKIRFDLNPPEMDYIFAMVSGETCKSGKYPERSWEENSKYTQMNHVRALQSHLYKYLTGIDKDPDSGLPTTWHLMWRAVAIAVNEMRNKTWLDDRPVLKQILDLSAEDYYDNLWESEGAKEECYRALQENKGYTAASGGISGGGGTFGGRVEFKSCNCGCGDGYKGNNK
jgi:hypothetical protein